MLFKLRQIAGSALNYFRKEPTFQDLVKNYNVIIMKHCSPASDVLEDEGEPNLSSEHQSVENYKAIYQHLGKLFGQHPDTLFMIWTLPPRHRLHKPLQGDSDKNAARATEFSNWLRTNFIDKWGINSNIYIWDFRNIVMDPVSNFLKYEYEYDHDTPNSHPNRLANNTAGIKFAEFIANSVTKFYGNKNFKNQIKTIFLHHSIGLNVYQYPHLGLPNWLEQYNTTHNVNYLITHEWYPKRRNMPIDYYHRWIG